MSIIVWLYVSDLAPALPSARRVMAFRKRHVFGNFLTANSKYTHKWSFFYVETGDLINFWWEVTVEHIFSIF